MYKTIFQSIFVAIFSVALGFVYSVMLARMLGPEDRGIYGSILMIATLISGISQLGLAQGYVYKSRKTNKNAFAFLLYSCAVITLISLLTLWLTHAYFMPIELAPFYFLVVLLALLTSLNSFFQNSAQIDTKLYSYNVMKAMIPIINIILLCLCFYLLNNYLSVITCVFIIITTTLISLAFLGNSTLIKEWHNAQKSSLKIKNAIGYSLKIYGISLVGIFINSIDKIVLLANGTMQEFGIYGVAYGLSRLIGIIPETISTIIYSRFAGYSEKELSEFINITFSCLFLPLLSVCIILAGLSTWFIPLIFGPEYKDSILPFIFLLCECVIASLGWLLSQRFNASGRPGLVLLRQIVSIIPLILICFYDFHQNILITVSVALLVSAILRLIITLLVYRKILNEPPPRLYPTKIEIKLILTAIKNKGISQKHEY
jgi:O-antigen/teichoic acid export membrane protein